MRYRYSPNSEGIKPSQVNRAIYRREPYVRAVIHVVGADPVTVLGKLSAWTDTRSLIQWTDDHNNSHLAWVPSADAVMIARHEVKPDPYDEPGAFGEDGFPDPAAGTWWIPPVPD